MRHFQPVEVFAGSGDQSAPKHLWGQASPAFPVSKHMPNELNVPGNYFRRADLLFHTGSNRPGINQNLREISLIDNMQGSKDKADQWPPLTFKHCFRDFFPRTFFENDLHIFSTTEGVGFIPKMYCSVLGLCFWEMMSVLRGLLCHASPVLLLSTPMTVSTAIVSSTMVNWASACFQVYF